jgi:hypothetical protein
MDGVLGVGDAHGRVYEVPAAAEGLRFVGQPLGALERLGRGRRLAVSVRFREDVTVLVERREGRCVVAASPRPGTGRALAPVEAPTAP